MKVYLGKIPGFKTVPKRLVARLQVVHNVLIKGIIKNNIGP